MVAQYGRHGCDGGSHQSLPLRSQQILGGDITIRGAFAKGWTITKVIEIGEWSNIQKPTINIASGQESINLDLARSRKCKGSRIGIWLSKAL